MADIPGGLLVAVEGIDGAGKTTLVSRLAEELACFGVPVTTAKEPTQGPHGQALRNTASTGRLTAADELTLLLADREQHVADVIAPALRSGGIVILDRYFYSNIAYQGAAGLDPQDVLNRNLAIAPPPDLLLLLDLPVEMGLHRIGARGDFANFFERPDTLAAARAIFLRFRPEFGVVVDATADADTVLTESLKWIVATITKKIHSADGFTIEAADRLRQVVGPVLATA